MLIKIGDFAKETGVTVKALRHYAKLGLLQPAWINRFNGYRYYASEQKTRLDLLLAYQKMGFSLAQIGMLLETQLTDQELISLLQKRKSALVMLVSDCDISQGRTNRAADASAG